MWLKAIWKGHPMRLELTRVGLLVELANHYTTRGAWSSGWMVNFRTLGDEAGSKCFDFLAMKPTFDLALPLSVSSFFGGPSPRLHGFRWSVNKSAGQVAAYCIHWRGEEKFPGPTFYWSANQNYDLVSRVSGRVQKLHPLLSLTGEPIDNIQLLYHVSHL